jgi:hypothetical protein
MYADIGCFVSVGRSDAAARPVRVDLTHPVTVGQLWIISGSDLTCGCWRWSARPVVVWRRASLCWSDVGLASRSLDRHIQSFIKCERRSKPAIGDRQSKFKARTHGTYRATGCWRSASDHLWPARPVVPKPVRWRAQWLYFMGAPI